MDTTTIHSPALLIALLIPLIGTLGVMFRGKEENIREGISSVSSLLLFVTVLFISRDVWSGKTLEFEMF